MIINKNITPSIYHCNGGFSSGVYWWEILLRKVFKDKSIYQSGAKPPILDIVLCHNLSDKTITESSLEYLGINDYIVVGRDVKQWENREKIKLVYDYITSQSKADYIMYLDSLDVVICSDIQSIFQTYLSEFSCDLLFNAEKNPYPASDKKRMIAPLAPSDVKEIVEFEREKYEKPFCYLNSGAYIGRRSFLKDVLGECLTMFEKKKKVWMKSRSDQIFFRYMHKRLYPRIQIDSQCKIFQTTAFINKSEFKSKYSIYPFDRFMAALRYVALNHHRKKLGKSPMKANTVD